MIEALYTLPHFRVAVTTHTQIGLFTGFTLHHTHTCSLALALALLTHLLSVSQLFSLALNTSAKPDPAA